MATRRGTQNGTKDAVNKEKRREASAPVTKRKPGSISYAFVNCRYREVWYSIRCVMTRRQECLVLSALTSSIRVTK